MDDVRKLVEENPHLEIITDDSGKEKVKCKLTGHQLPWQLSEIINYIKGKKYQRLSKGLAGSEQKQAVLACQEYRKYLVPAEKRRNQLYCKVTKKFINDIPHHIELHVHGKRFQRALKVYKDSEEQDKDPSTVNQNESNIWEPSDSESVSEPDIDPLPDSFGEEEDEDEYENVGDEDENEDADKQDVDNDENPDGDENNDDDGVSIEKKKRKRNNSDKKQKLSKKKIKAKKIQDVERKLTKTRKRKSEEDVEEPKVVGKARKESKNKVPSRKKPKRTSKK